MLHLEYYLTYIAGILIQWNLNILKCEIGILCTLFFVIYDFHWIVERVKSHFPQKIKQLERCINKNQLKSLQKKILMGWFVIDLHQYPIHK